MPPDAHASTGAFVGADVDLDDVLSRRDSPLLRAARAADVCSDCCEPLGPDWDVDRSILRCAAPLGGGRCNVRLHDACADLRADDLACCPACRNAQRVWCRVHAAALTARCVDCAGAGLAPGHVRNVCARRRADGHWRCATHARGASPPATKLVPRSPAAIVGPTSNQGAFVRAGTGLTDPAFFGFVFATRSELAVARALDGRRVWWTSNVPIRVNDDGGRRTREVDFLVITGGVPGILELDGAPHDGRAADDHAEDRALKRAGIWVVERVPSAEALRAPDHVVGRFLNMVRAYGRRAA